MTLIDCFAQAEANYPTHGSKIAFCHFVIEHSPSQRDILQRTCPVTLYYDYREDYIIPAIPFIPGEIIGIDEDRMQEQANTYLLFIPEEKRNAAREKHQYIKLIYQLRNKLVHEMNPLGTMYNMISNYPAVVSYSSIGLEEIADGKMPEHLWALSFPKEYIHQLACETINHKLDQCAENNTLPFPLYKEPRKCELCWYDN